MILSVFLNLAVTNSNPTRPLLMLRSGETLSVQASPVHNSCPLALKGPYTEVEVAYTGLKKSIIVSLLPYKSNADGVYNLVPMSLVTHIVAANGGISREIEEEV